MADFSRESMLDMFIFEMNQLVDQLEQLIIECEDGYSMDNINEIFRIMHTVKGSAAMMMYENISKTAHATEDLFFFLRYSFRLAIIHPGIYFSLRGKCSQRHSSK